MTFRARQAVRPGTGARGTRVAPHTACRAHLKNVYGALLAMVSGRGAGAHASSLSLSLSLSLVHRPERAGLSAVRDRRELRRGLEQRFGTAGAARLERRVTVRRASDRVLAVDGGAARDGRGHGRRDRGGLHGERGLDRGGEVEDGVRPVKLHGRRVVRACGRGRGRVPPEVQPRAAAERPDLRLVPERERRTPALGSSPPSMSRARARAGAHRPSRLSRWTPRNSVMRRESVRGVET